MSSFAARLADRNAPALLLDAGLATDLEAAGHDLRDDLWSARLLLDDPAAIEAAHARFVAANVDVLTTASYQASLQGLAARGLDRSQALRLIASATDLARNATARADRTVFVAASAGSYGATLADGSEYCGDYNLSRDALADFHRSRLPAFAHADVIAFETVPCLLEAHAIADACASLPAGLGAWVSFSCSDPGHVAHGEPIEACVKALERCDRVLAVGINCCDPAWVESLLRRIGDATSRPTIAYPNSSEHYEGAWHGERLAPEAFAELAQTWLEAGARAIGGCCRTTVHHLVALREALVARPHVIHR